MKTQVIQIKPGMPGYNEALKRGADLLQRGDIVAFPTETVYGLGADGQNPEAIRKIYEAKGRPSDNPLILHVASMDMADRLAVSVPECAKRAMKAFWPGPLTVILPKSSCVPDCVTGGLPSVAIRMPAHPVAQDLIKAAGLPVAAPSANASGRPSPTLAEHVTADLDGKIPLILDGGPVSIGVESTIVDFTVDPPVILRPGRISGKELEEATGSRICWDGNEDGSTNTKTPKAPGMKYTHYAPRADMILVLGQDIQKVINQINELTKEQKQKGKKVGIIGTDRSVAFYQGDEVVSLGDRNHMETIVANLYKVLRSFDQKDIDIIFSEGFENEEYGTAIMNRLRKAAGQRMIRTKP